MDRPQTRFLDWNSNSSQTEVTILVGGKVDMLWIRKSSEALEKLVFSAN